METFTGTLIRSGTLAGGGGKLLSAGGGKLARGKPHWTLQDTQHQEIDLDVSAVKSVADGFRSQRVKVVGDIEFRNNIEVLVVRSIEAAT